MIRQKRKIATWKFVLTGFGKPGVAVLLLAMVVHEFEQLVRVQLVLLLSALKSNQIVNWKTVQRTPAQTGFGVNGNNVQKSVTLEHGPGWRRVAIRVTITIVNYFVNYTFYIMKLFFYELHGFDYIWLILEMHQTVPVI